MKNLFVRASAVMAISLFMLVCGMQNPTLGQDREEVVRSIDGVWRTVITPRNCVNGDPLAPPFAGLFTVNVGGTMAEYGISPGLTQSTRSPGHGIWRKLRGWQDYGLTFTFLRYNPAGAYIGSQRVRATATIGESGNDFSTISTIEVYDANNNLVGTGCATAAATRFDF